MNHRVLASALLVVFAAACGGDGGVTEPTRVPTGLTGFAAIGTDPRTGATIETNLDDYVPGQVVHLRGSSWAPNETVSLVMTEDPDTHDDISRTIVADSTGSFAFDFYDVQEHDLGVRFTLTATGLTSGSQATALFTDNRVIDKVELLDPATNVFVVAPSQVTIPASSSITIRVTGTTNSVGGGGAAADDWQSTRWRLRGPSPGNGDAASSCNSDVNIATATVGAVHTFTITAPVTSGVYTVEVTAFRSNSCVDGPSVEEAYSDGVKVEAVTNQPPTAMPGGPYAGNEGASIALSGTTSTDSDGTIQAYAWTYSVTSADAGATCSITNANTVAPSITCNEDGTYAVKLIVTDDDGAASAEVSAQLVVSNVAPVVSAGADATIGGGATFSQNGSFTDPGTDSWTATVDYGDGAGAQSLALTGKTFSLSHSYGASGTYTVKVTVTDDDNGSHTDEVKVNVNNNAPVVQAGDATASLNEGSTFTQNGSFTDPDADSWTATVDYGDGGGSQALTLVGKTFSLSHLYADNGTYTVTVTVTDDKNGSASDVITVTVNNVTPTVDAGANGTANEGSAFTRNGLFTDPGADTWAATVDYGDGSGVQALALSGKTFALSHTYADNGNYTVTVKVKDDEDAEGTDQFTVAVANVAPTVAAGAAATINEGATFTRGGSFTDPGADTWTATVNYGDGSGVQALTLGAGKTFNLSHAYPNDGVFTVTITVTDDEGASDSDEVQVTVNNVLPLVIPGANATINEGSTFSQGGSFTDPGADTWTATVDYGDGSGAQSLILNGKTFALSHTYTDNGTYTVTVTVYDDDGNGTDQVMITVNNVAPVITSLTVPVVPIAAGSNNVTVTWAFTDPGSDTWACQIKWDNAPGFDFEPMPATYAANPTKTCSATKTLTAGIYTVTAKVIDDDNGSDEEGSATYIVVYDPNAGFVTGGGWINSQPGAYRLDTSLGGKANFGFVSKYKKGMTVPDGNTEFQFHAGNLNFKSTAYDWLVVASYKAQFKGVGTINGSGTYYFLLSAIDGQINGGGGTDKFRMKIWRMNGTVEEVVYDNQLNEAVDAEPTTVLGGGSINIQAK